MSSIGVIGDLSTSEKIGIGLSLLGIIGAAIAWLFPRPRLFGWFLLVVGVVGLVALFWSALLWWQLLLIGVAAFTALLPSLYRLLPFRVVIERKRAPKRELENRNKLREFISSRMRRLLEEHGKIMDNIGRECGKVPNTELPTMHWFANLSLEKGIRQIYRDLRSTVDNDLTAITPIDTIHSRIIEFFNEYQNVAAFPRKIEAPLLTKSDKVVATPKDKWEDAQERCKEALSDLETSQFATALRNERIPDSILTLPPSQR
jgi:hypothetical protein